MAPKLVNERSDTYILYMMMKQETIEMTDLTLNNAERLGVATVLADHDNVHVRMAVDWLADAMEQAKAGNLRRVHTLIRMAADSNDQIPFGLWSAK